MAKIKTRGLRVRTKIMGTIAILVLISVSVCLFTYWGFFRVNSYLVTISDHYIPELTLTDDTEAQLAQARRFESEFFLYSSIDTPNRQQLRQAAYDNLLEAHAKLGAGIKELLRVQALAVGMEPESRNDSAHREKSGEQGHGEQGHGDFEDEGHLALFEMTQRIDRNYQKALQVLPVLAARLLDGESFMETQQEYLPYRDALEVLARDVSAIRTSILEHLSRTRADVHSFHGDMNNYVLIALAILIYISVHAGTFMSQRVTTPLNNLISGIQAVGAGKFEALKVNSSDEYGLIAETFNDTMSRLRDFIQTDEERKQTQENLINFLEVVSEASEGDLTLTAPVTADAFGSIADAYNLMIQSLSDQLLDTRAKALEVSSESQRLSEIFMRLSKGATEQTLQSKAASEAASQTQSMTALIAEKATMAQENSEKMGKATAQGSTLVQQNMEGMQLIRITVQIINKKMKSLAERLLEIDTISGLISEVATRTTILAMNASIEAARAGDQGKGFLVISDEIKRLADQASEATRRIGGIVKAIQTEAAEVTGSLEEETRTVEDQSRLAQDTGYAFMEIQKSIRESDSVVTQIHGLSQQQQHFTQQTTQAILQVTDISERALRMVQDSARIAEGLDNMALTLQQSLSRFRLPDETAGDDGYGIQELPEQLGA